LQYIIKKYKKIIGFITIAIFIAIFSSCNYAKHIGKNETLLWQNRVVLKGKYNAADGIDFLNQLNAAIAQTPNTALFGLDLETLNLGYHVPRIKLLNYNLFYNRLAKGKDSNLLRNNLLQLPVVYDSKKTNITKNILKIICDNNGFSNAKIRDSVVQKPRQKSCVYYVVEPGPNFNTSSVRYSVDNRDIDSILNTNKKQTFLKWNEPLTKTNISLERTRIASLLVENGYFNFRQSAIKIVIDTVDKEMMKVFDNPFEQIALLVDTNRQKKIAIADVEFIISDSINNEKIKKFYIGNIEVEVQDANTKNAKVYSQIKYKNLVLRNVQSYIKPDVLFDNIYIQSGQIFSSNKIDATINRLKSFSAFQNIKVDLKKVNDSNIVNCIIILTMNKNYEIHYELEGSNGSQYDLGLGVKGGIKNNNVFKRGYQLNTVLQIGLQSLINRTDSGSKLELWQLNGGVSTDLKIPQFLLPGFLHSNLASRAPQTNIGLSTNINQRPGFTQTTANGQITYSWRQNKRIIWKVTPAFLTLVSTSNLSPNIQSVIDNNPTFKQQLQPFTILGSNVNFEYTNKLPRFQYFYTYYRCNLEKAGSLINTIYSDVNNARYAKVEMELKHYINSAQGKNWVNRLYIYAGLPIKQNTLPFIKQQNIGGPFSLRGWRVFELGPGPVLDSSGSNTRFLNNNGDIKLEANTEMRIPIIKLFSGAMKLEWAGFIDAGNIWRYKDSSKNGISQFSFTKIPKDIAINTGMGIRFDLSIFLIRADYGIPIRQPYITKNNGWIINNNPSTAWYKRNGTWQIGINYPF
jgi:outer membrane protein insertion porin family